MSHVTNPRSFPYHCVGLLEITVDGGGKGWGTGTLIDEVHIVTAAHNLLTPDGTAVAAKFHPGYSAPANQPPAGGLEVNYGCVKTIYARSNPRDRSWDIGVYKLLNPWYLKQYMELQIVDGNNVPMPEMRVAGYPGTEHYYMCEEEELVSGFDVPAHLFAYSHATSTGSSGSPLYQYRDGKARIYGIHRGRAGNAGDKTGVLITQETAGFVKAAKQWRGSDYFVVKIE